MSANAINSRHTPVFSTKLQGLGGEFQTRYKCFKQEKSRQIQVNRGLSQDNNKRNEVFTVNRIKIRLIIGAIGSALLLGSGVSMAQDSDGALKYGQENDDARYIRVTFVSYKPGMAGARIVIEFHRHKLILTAICGRTKICLCLLTLSIPGKRRYFHLS